MKELLSMIDVAKIRKLMRNRDFIFCIIAYPLAVIVWVILRIYITDIVSDDSDFAESFGGWYIFITTVVFGGIAIVSTFERIETKYMHKNQGDKLKLKQMEGNWKG